MDCEFRWNRWNLAHIAEHGIEPGAAEHVVRHARPPWPRYVGQGKFEVFGQTQSGGYLHAIYIKGEEDDGVYVIHARPMTDPEKRRYRRKRP